MDNIIGGSNYPTSSGAISTGKEVERRCSDDHNAYRDYRKYNYCPHCGKFIAKSLLASSVIINNLPAYTKSTKPC